MHWRKQVSKTIKKNICKISKKNIGNKPPTVYVIIVLRIELLHYVIGF